MYYSLEVTTNSVDKPPTGNQWGFSEIIWIIQRAQKKHYGL